MAHKIKILILDFTFISIFSYVILYILEFIKPGIVSNYVDLNKLFTYLLIVIVFSAIISQIKKVT
ncbi:MAG TPA: hypothetical protein PLD95_01020 [bacterium]|jgi:hypothetical protein|nr:hypothetical protein [bacterium]HOG38036.1 hypothetical protein [bacterium]